MIQGLGNKEEGSKHLVRIRLANDIQEGLNGVYQQRIRQRGESM